MNCSARLIAGPLCFVAAGCASLEPIGGGSQASTLSTLELYGDAYSIGQLGFSCIPVDQRERSEVERSRLQLRERRLVIREQLARRYGVERLDAIERAFFEGLDTVHFVPGSCKYAPDQRGEYARLLSELERRIASGTF